MSKSDDPERLLAEALRAQAVSAPVTMPPLPAVLASKPGPLPAAPVDAAPVDDEPVDVEEPAVAEDEAVAEPPAAETPEAEAPEVTASEPETAQVEAPEVPPPARPQSTSDHPFTEEMVLRELSSGPMTGELATIRINNAQQAYDTERFSPLENLYGPVGGPGFGLISGSEVGSTVGPPVGEFDHLLPEPPTRAVATNAVPTTKMRAERGQVPGWLILLFALALGLAGGAVAGLLSML